MAGPLAGVRIVDVSAVISGPLATGWLADQGADVVKIEPPGVGDVLRFIGSRRGGLSGTFHVTNRGKRGMVLDLRQPRGLEILLELVRRADVFVQNFRPGVADRMGIGWEALRAENPRLIYASINGFGPSGPYAQRRVYDNVIQAFSGFAAVQSDAATGEPDLLRQFACDKITSLTAAQAITAALVARANGGGGQHLELAMLDAAVAFLWSDAAGDVMMLGEGVDRQPTVANHYRVTRLADGYATITVLSDSEYRGLCRAIGRPELADDPRFATIVGRMQNLEELIAFFQGELAEIAARIGRDEFEARLSAEDVPCGLVRELTEVHLDPQVAQNEILVEREHPGLGRVREPRPPVRFSRTPAAAGARAPLPGEHTDEILRELGLAGEIAALRAAKVVA